MYISISITTIQHTFSPKIKQIKKTRFPCYVKNCSSSNVDNCFTFLTINYSRFIINIVHVVSRKKMMFYFTCMLKFYSDFCVIIIEHSLRQKGSTNETHDVLLLIVRVLNTRVSRYIENKVKLHLITLITIET